MTALLWVAGCVGYLIAGFLVLAVYSRIHPEDDGPASGVVVLWPLMVVGGAFYGVHLAIEAIARRFIR